MEYLRGLNGLDLILIVGAVFIIFWALDRIEQKKFLKRHKKDL